MPELKPHPLNRVYCLVGEAHGAFSHPLVAIAPHENADKIVGVSIPNNTKLDNPTFVNLCARGTCYVEIVGRRPVPGDFLMVADSEGRAKVAHERRLDGSYPNCFAVCAESPEDDSNLALALLADEDTALIIQSQSPESPVGIDAAKGDR